MAIWTHNSGFCTTSNQRQVDSLRGDKVALVAMMQANTRQQLQATLQLLAEVAHKYQTMHITNKRNIIQSMHLHHTQPQPPNNQHSQIGPT